LTRPSLTLIAATAVVVGLFAPPPSAHADTRTADPAPVLAERAPQTKPNIVLITTDDQTVADLEHMPYTRRLLGDAGTTFSDAISPFPLCCPARATLLTGQHAHNHGVLSNGAPHGGYQAIRPFNSETLPNWLQDVGYRTVFAGKYLNGYGHGYKTEVPAGWDDWNAAARNVYNYWDTSVNHNGEVVDRSGEYVADLTQQVMQRTIAEGAQSPQPFFVWQSNLAPHGACHPKVYEPGCRWSWPMADTEDESRFTDLPLAAKRHPAFDERVAADKPMYVQNLKALDAGRVNRMTHVHRYRVRSLQAVDRNVRDTVRQLEATGQLDETVIIFASDNGYLQGQHRWVGKTLPYEESLRIPMLMRGPGVPAGTRVSETTSLVDLPATIADIADADPALVQDGRSLVHVANGGRGYRAVAIEAGAVEEALDGGYFYRGVRTPRYTYLEYPQTGERELYDRKLDPGQTVNVAYRPTHRETRRALEEMLERLRSCAGVDCRTVSGRIPPPEAPQGPVHPDELASAADADQLVTVTGRDWRSRQGTAVAWEKRGESWRRVRGPIPIQLGSKGMARPHAWRLSEGRTHGRVSDYRGWFQHGAVFDRDHPSRISAVLPDPGQRVAGIPVVVGNGGLMLHTEDRPNGHGRIAMPAEDLRRLLRWVSGARGNSKVVVGTPAFLRSHL
jgi:N-acetylglucosamine-6-sulfatase